MRTYTKNHKEEKALFEHCKKVAQKGGVFDYERVKGGFKMIYVFPGKNEVTAETAGRYPKLILVGMYVTLSSETDSTRAGKIVDKVTRIENDSTFPYLRTITLEKHKNKLDGARLHSPSLIKR